MSDTRRAVSARHVWPLLCIVALVVAVVVQAGFFSASADICDEFHESPNNIGGWSIGVVALGAAAAIGWRWRGQLGLVRLAAGLIPAALLFAWWTLPAGTC